MLILSAVMVLSTSSQKKTTSRKEYEFIEHHVIPKVPEHAWDKDDKRNDELIHHGTVIIAGAGRGKTDTAVKALVKRYGADRVACVTPYNKQAHGIKKKGIKSAMTYHKFFGESCNGQSSSRAKPFDLSGYKAVFFDEIWLYSYPKLNNILDFVTKQNNLDPDAMVECIAAGDENQLPPIQEKNNPALILTDEQKKQMITSHRMFPHILKLRYNHRLDTDDDRAKMGAFEDDIFTCDDNKSAVDVIDKHFPGQILKTLDEVRALGITRAVTYFVDSARYMNNFHMNTYMRHHAKSAAKKLENGVSYFSTHVGAGGQVMIKEELICKYKHEAFALDAKGGVTKEKEQMHKNYTYTIKKFNATGFILTDELTGHDFHVADEVIMSKFSLAYANTCHSSQGDSIDEKFVVCDYNMNKYVARHWVYTAVSRTRSMKNVYFLSANIKHRSDEDVNHFLAEKVGDYARQDRAKGRLWSRHLYGPMDPRCILCQRRQVHSLQVCHVLHVRVQEASDR